MKKIVSSKIFIILLIIFVLMIFFILSLVFGFECPFYTIFHLKCPFCGGRNMIMSLIRFDVVTAFNSNQLLFVATPIIFLLLFIKYILNKDIKIHKIIYILLIIITIVFTIVRNII